MGERIRIGYGLGTGASSDAERLLTLVDALDANRFDSLWLSERVAAPAPDPVVGLAVAAGRSPRLKLGTSVLVVPGRNPVLLAKSLATLDRLSGGRLLPAFGLGVADPIEQQGFGVARGERAEWFDEAVPLIRRLWTGEPVDHDGPRFHYQGVRVEPRPVQDPPDVWLGGRAPSELRRVGRLGDGWLPSFCTAAEAEAGRRLIKEEADRCGRAIDPGHWGALVIYTRGGEVPERLGRALAARRPDVDPRDLIAVGLAEARARLEQFIAVGFSKFVLAPAHEPPSWDDELGEVADAVLDLQA